MTGGDGARDAWLETAAMSDEILYPTFDDYDLAELAGFGHRRPIAAGEVLFGPGNDAPDFFVVLEGGVEVVRLDEGGEAVIATFAAGQFVGELGLVTGQRPQLTTRANPRLTPCEQIRPESLGRPRRLPLTTLRNCDHPGAHKP
jgi:CRP-like cAMP-binding protein